MRTIGFVIVVILMAVAAIPVSADEQITYISQPDEVGIFLNNIAFARDEITLVSDADIQIVLPNEVYADTVIVRENEQTVPQFRINRSTGQTILSLSAQASSEATRRLTLEYLLAGLSWKPNYNMWLDSENPESVLFDFSVEIQNTALTLEGVQTTLIAGRVDVSQQIDTISTITTNQYIAGYVEPEAENGVSVGPVSIQHLYPLGEITAAPGDMLYSSVLQREFAARRLYIWNAQTDLQATVIYKVGNTSDVPLPEGIVRSYQDGLFVGSDFIEVTPIGSEGSVTVGGLQDLRVNRAASQFNIAKGLLNDEFDTRTEVTLTLSNFSSDPIEVQVVDTWNPYAQNFSFSQEPEFSPDNLLRWTVTVPAGETVTITYEFILD